MCLFKRRNKLEIPYSSLLLEHSIRWQRWYLSRCLISPPPSFPAMLCGTHLCPRLTLLDETVYGDIILAYIVYKTLGTSRPATFYYGLPASSGLRDCSFSLAGTWCLPWFPFRAWNYAYVYACYLILACNGVCVFSGCCEVFLLFSAFITWQTDQITSYKLYGS